MSDAKTVEAQFTDRINELAKKVAPMAEVLEAVAERDNELGKTKEEKDKKWKEILGVIEDVKGLKGDFEEMQTAIAERKISFASDALPEKRSKRAILHDTARYSLGLIRASKWGGNDPTYLNTVVEQISKAGPLTSGTATGGAEFVPTILASEIYMLLEDEGEAMGLCTPIPMESMTEKVADPGSVIVTWQSVLGGEGTAATDQAPTTGDADLAADTLIATMGLTNQLLKTSKVDLVQVYTTRFIRRMTREWESQILQGSGTPFTGISDVSGANEIVLDATKTKPEDVTFENIADLVGDLGDPCRVDAKAHRVLDRDLLPVGRGGVCRKVRIRARTIFVQVGGRGVHHLLRAVDDDALDKRDPPIQSGLHDPVGDPPKAGHHAYGPVIDLRVTGHKDDKGKEQSNAGDDDNSNCT